MHCPFCHFQDTRVVDSRLTEDGAQVRRRRECEQCNERFTTFESVEFKLPAIIKQDGRREPYDERKLRSSLERALHKRPAGSNSIDKAVDAIKRELRAIGDREVLSRKIGDWVMAELRRIDQVAYVRFASVYRRFEDVQAFREEVEQLERDLPALEGKQMSLLEAGLEAGSALSSAIARKPARMRFAYLADYLQLAPQLAQLHYAEWGTLLTDWSQAEALAELRTHIQRQAIPTTLLAFTADERLIGSVSLLQNDDDRIRDYSPWLASLFVLPEYRGNGYGIALVRHCEQEASALGVKALYLYSAGQESFYEKLGWQRLAQIALGNSAVTVMIKQLQPIHKISI